MTLLATSYINKILSFYYNKIIDKRNFSSKKHTLCNKTSQLLREGMRIKERTPPFPLNATVAIWPLVHEYASFHREVMFIGTYICRYIYITYPVIWTLDITTIFSLTIIFEQSHIFQPSLKDHSFSY